MNKKDNRRVVMTKRIIKDVFIEMLEKKSIQKIYVRELCVKADINRSTFYKYYESQYDLLAEIENDLLIEIEEKCKDTDNTKGLNNILQYISRNKKTYKVVFNANIDPMFPKNENKYKKIYILEGGYHVILKWLNNDCRESPEEITRLVMKYINQNL